MSEIQLLNRLRSGDQKAFKELYMGYYKPLCMKAYLVLKDEEQAEDVVQDVFEKLWKKKSFPENTLSLEAYLSRVVRNACYDQLKKAKRMDGDIEDVRQLSPDPFETMALKELMQHLDASMDDLPKQCKRIFDLVYLENKKYQEVAEIMDVSINTVKTQLKRGLAKLRQSMKRYK